MRKCKDVPQGRVGAAPSPRCVWSVHGDRKELARPYLPRPSALHLHCSADPPPETTAIKAQLKELRPLVVPGLRGVLKGLKLDGDASALFDKFAVQQHGVPSGKERSGSHTGQKKALKPELP